MTCKAAIVQPITYRVFPNDKQFSNALRPFQYSRCLIGRFSLSNTPTPGETVGSDANALVIQQNLQSTNVVPILQKLCGYWKLRRPWLPQ